LEALNFKHLHQVSQVRKPTWAPKIPAAARILVLFPTLSPLRTEELLLLLRGKSAFGCANIIAYSCTQNLILAARGSLKDAHIIKHLSSQGLGACLFFSPIYTSLGLSECV
jgi:hypothetical protein